MSHFVFRFGSSSSKTSWAVTDWRKIQKYMCVCFFCGKLKDTGDAFDKKLECPVNDNLCLLGCCPMSAGKQLPVDVM